MILSHHLKALSSMPRLPPLHLICEAHRTGRKLALIDRVIIIDQKKHDAWADRWLGARSKIWARYCHQKMKSCTHNTVEWRIVD